MKINIPVREIRTYQSADGVKVEEHKKLFVAIMEVESEDEIKEINLDDNIYIGLLDIVIPPMPPQTVKFPLEGVFTLKEAMNLYPKACEEFIKNNIENHSNIVRASEGDLNALGYLQEDSNSSKIII